MANEHDIKVLNSLITTTIDSANGFERSAAISAPVCTRRRCAT